MQQRFLGRSGMPVSELCLSTMTFGQDTDEASAHRILDAVQPSPRRSSAPVRSSG